MKKDAPSEFDVGQTFFHESGNTSAAELCVGHHPGHFL
jgi:hypothetical protein